MKHRGAGLRGRVLQHLLRSCSGSSAVVGCDSCGRGYALPQLQRQRLTAAAAAQQRKDLRHCCWCSDCLNVLWPVPLRRSSEMQWGYGTSASGSSSGIPVLGQQQHTSVRGIPQNCSA